MKPRQLQRDPETDALLVVLTKGAFALISEEDAEWVGQYSWYLHNGAGSYARRHRGPGAIPSQIMLHREVMERLLSIPVDYQVDHIDGNSLDCRRANLRVCEKQGNDRNKKCYANNALGVKGVHWAKDRGRYRASIRAEGRLINLGGFYSIEDAQSAYEAAAVKYFGEFKRDRDDY